MDETDNSIGSTLNIQNLVTTCTSIENALAVR